MAPIGLFLTGCAGSGKSWHAHRFINKCGENGMLYSIIVIGFTARSIMGYNNCGYTTVAYATLIENGTLKVPQILIIEEVGMLSSHEFTKIVRISQSADLILLVGDVYQIKPMNGEMFFNCAAWHNMFDTATVHRFREVDISLGKKSIILPKTAPDNKSKIIILLGNKRSNDDELNMFLNQLRKSLRTRQQNMAVYTIRHVLSRKPVCNGDNIVTSHDKFKGVHLFYRREEVHLWNKKCGGLKLNGPCIVTKNIMSTSSEHMYYARNGENAIVLDVCCPLSTNYDMVSLLLKDCANIEVSMKTIYYLINGHRWIPDTHIAPGYAITIHRSQGDTFENGVVVHPKHFPDGCVFYVAVSRCNTFEGLVIDGTFTEQTLLRGLDDSTIAFINKYDLF